MITSHLSWAQCQSELRQLYQNVQEVVTKRHQDRQSLVNVAFLDEWNSPSWQAKHLPLSVQLVSRRFADEDRPQVEYYCPHRPTTPESPCYLLLMAGFSVEQLVLSMAFHYRQAIERKQPLAGFVPFIGEGPGISRTSMKRISVSG